MDSKKDDVSFVENSDGDARVTIKTLDTNPHGKRPDIASYLFAKPAEIAIS